MKTIRYCQKPEEGLNPFIGFTSFQHFRNEKLYSDIVVRPENHMTETENVECYPIPDDVPQNGREEGWYPDSTVAYFRILWKEFEPQQGVYNYGIIEDLLEKARQNGQTVTFRLLPHSTRASDDVPDWLKALIPCPERPEGKRVKESPTDPLFLKLFGRAIRKIGERFDNDPTFHTIDICLPGAWGEGHRLEDYPDEDIQALLDTFMDCFPHTRLVAQIGLPWLVNYANSKRPVGWRGDGCGNPEHLESIYPEKIAQLTPDPWKTAPVSFESYWWLGEWQRRGWNIDDIIEKTLSWHVSCFNAKSIAFPVELKDKVNFWLSKMGYHLSPVSLTFPETAQAGEPMTLELVMDNHGVAPLYEDVPVWLRLKNGTQVREIRTDLKPIDWLPGQTVSRFTVTLPADMEKGLCEISMGLHSDTVSLIYWGTDAPRDGAYYRMGYLTIE